MIVHKINKYYQTRSDKPNENWLNDEWFVVADDSNLANKIIELYPYYDFILNESNELVDIIEREKTEEEIAENRIVEIKDRLDALDSIITRQVEQLYIDTNTMPSYAPIQEAIAEKQALRIELQQLQ